MPLLENSAILKTQSLMKNDFYSTSAQLLELDGISLIKMEIYDKF